MYGCMSGLSILIHSSISIFMPLPHSFDYCSSVVTFGSGKYYYSNCVLFSRLFWPFRVPCNPIWIWGSVFLFLWKRLLGIWPELNWFCRSLWAIFSSVAQSCPTLCDPINRSTPGLPVHHQLLEFTQTHVHWVGDAIQPSHPLSSASPPAPNPSQHQSLFQWVNSSHEVGKLLEFQL